MQDFATGEYVANLLSPFICPPVPISFPHYAEQPMMKNETLFGFDDNLTMNEEVGSWSEAKYAQFRNYAQIFTQGMSKRWDSLTYLDLYAGSGLSRVKGTNQILLGSPLIALSIDVPFSRYVFCEKDKGKLDALRVRVTRDFPNAKAQFVLGDCDDPSFQLGSYIAPRALTLCFVDPYSIDIRFSTIRSLAAGRSIDFLCLLASRMDAGRNPHNYPREECKKVDLLLDSQSWRDEWETYKSGLAKEPNFGDFIRIEFSKRMESIGFLPTPLHEMRPIKLDNGVTIYHLALYSKHERAKDFWRKASLSSTAQRPLAFD